MGAKTKPWAAATMLLVSMSTAWAQDGSKAHCENLAAITPRYIADSLRVFSDDVLGKPADLWLEEDFRNLAANAVDCDGFPPGVVRGSQVNASLWIRELNRAAKTVLPVSAVTAAVRNAYEEVWTWGPLPGCASLLKWKRDPVWYTDNSRELFGTGFREMDAVQRQVAVGFAKECQGVMEAVLKQSRQESETAGRIVKDIALAVEREGEAATENPEDLVPGLRVVHDNRRIPLSYLGPSARRMVEEVNDYEKAGRTMPVEKLVALSSWSENASRDGRQGPEAAYAQAIREIVGKHMFGR